MDEPDNTVFFDAIQKEKERRRNRRLVEQGRKKLTSQEWEAIVKAILNND